MAKSRGTSPGSDWWTKMQARHDERMSTLKMLVDAAPNEAERKKIIKKEIQKILRKMKASHARTTKKLAKMRKKWDEKFGKPSKKKRI